MIKTVTRGNTLKFRFILLLVSLLVTSLAFAQRQNGTIEGAAQDMEGQPIPGATIIASSPSLIGGGASTFTDQNGHYRFPVLSPGTYEVKVELQGLQTVVHKGIDVSVGQTLTVDFTLQLTAVSEALEVTEKPPLIDVSTTAVSFTVPSEIIHNLPKIENVEDLLRLTPGVGDDLVAYGGDGTRANSIWVDGVNVSDPRLGNISVAYNNNWIQEVQVTGIGAPAEYGGFTGVVGNFITRSGGNQFHGLFETFFQNQDLSFTNTPDPAPKVPFHTYDVSAQVGGPIVHDKLWFFSGFEYPHTSTQPFGYDGATTEIYKKFITKLTYKWNENNNLQGFAHLDNDYFDGQGANAKTTPEATSSETFHQASWNATWISVWSPETSFEGRLGGTYEHEIPIEDNPDLAGHTNFNNDFYVNSIRRIDDKRVRMQANAALSHHAQNFIHGSHDFRFGVEFERSSAFKQSRFNGDAYYFDNNDGSPYFRYLSEGYDFEGHNHRASTYVQDEWNLSDSVTISAGVRWDHNRGLTDRGTVFKNDPVAPRIGLVWMLDRGSQTVIKVHYGDYYEGLLESNYFFLSDKAALMTFQSYLGNGQWDQGSSHIRNFTSSDQLKDPYIRQFNAGFDRVMSHDIPIGVQYIHRRWGNILEDISLSSYTPVPYVNPLTGETITVFSRIGRPSYFLTNPPELYRQYDGLEFYVSKQLPNRVSVSGSFVYSNMKGNTPGLAESGFAAVNTPFLDSPNSLINQGTLWSDRPIAWKIAGTAPLPWGFNTGWFFRHTSGNTWAAQIFPNVINRPRTVIFLEPAGSRRFPSRNLLDLRFEKEFPIHNGQLRTTVDVFNVFNSSYVTQVFRFFDSPDFGEPQSYNDPRQIRLGLRYTF